MPDAWTIALALLVQTPHPTPPRAGPAAPAVNRPAPPVQTPGRADVPPAPDAPRITLAILHAGDLDHAALVRAIQLRSPALALVAVGDKTPPPVDGELRAYIELTRSDPGHVDLTLILADGRAYLRRVDVDPHAPARPVAGALANLIAGIEDLSVSPDRKDAPVPVALISPEPLPKPQPKPQTPPQTDPTTPASPAPTPPPPRWQLGPTLRLGTSLGLSNPDPGLRGLLLAGGLDARSFRGLLLSLDLQWLARPLGDYFVGRTRVAIGVGYALRRRGLDLPVAILVGVEPWRIRDPKGDPAHLSTPEGRPLPLLGAGLRVSPGYGVVVGKSTFLRAGLRLELWASGQPAPGGLRRPELRLDDRQSIGLGGAELHLGLELGVMFGAGSAPGQPPVKPRTPMQTTARPR